MQQKTYLSISDLFCSVGTFSNAPYSWAMKQPSDNSANGYSSFGALDQINLEQFLQLIPDLSDRLACHVREARPQ